MILEPCPFCGCDLNTYPLLMLIEKSQINTDREMVGCPVCSAQGPAGYSIKEAANKWNGRKNNDQR